MKLLVLTAPLLALALVAFAVQKPGEQKPGGDKKTAGPPDMAEMMAAMQRVGTPGAEHKALEPFAGSWDAKVSMYMDPSAPATESSGTMVSTWILGGRFLEQKYSGDMMGMKFEGTGIWGYDVAAKKYVGTWIDSMTTGIMRSTGSASKDGKSFTMTSAHTDPMTGKDTAGEETITLDNPNQHTMVMSEMRDGKMVKGMQIVYTRKK